MTSINTHNYRQKTFLIYQFHILSTQTTSVGKANVIDSPALVPFEDLETVSGVAKGQNISVPSGIIPQATLSFIKDFVGEIDYVMKKSALIKKKQRENLDITASSNEESESNLSEINLSKEKTPANLANC
jgi:hypothetical protein